MLFSKFISNLFLFSMINIIITTNYILKNNLLYLQEIIERNIANIGRTTQKDIVSKSNNYIHNIHTHTSHQEITPLKEKKEINENHIYIYILMFYLLYRYTNGGHATWKRKPTRIYCSFRPAALWTPAVDRYRACLCPTRACQRTTWRNTSGMCRSQVNSNARLAAPHDASFCPRVHA